MVQLLARVKRQQERKEGHDVADDAASIRKLENGGHGHGAESGGDK